MQRGETCVQQFREYKKEWARDRSLTLEEAKASAKLLYNDVKQTVEVFEKHLSFEFLTDDFNAFKPFLSIAVLAKDVRMAFKRLQEPHNKKATEIFNEVVIELVKGAAHQIIQRSANVAGDEKFDNACNSLDSDYTSAGKFNMKNFDAILSGMVFEVLRESLQSVLREAYSMRSATRSEEHHQEVESGRTKALDLLALVDNALCLRLAQCMDGLAGELKKVADSGSAFAARCGDHRGRNRLPRSLQEGLHGCSEAHALPASDLRDVFAKLIVADRCQCRDKRGFVG